jgi:hypothetical protein
LDPALVAGAALPAGAGVEEGEALVCGAGVFTGEAAALADVWAGVDDGLGLACWPELPAAPAVWAVAVAAITIASAKT